MTTTDCSDLSAPVRCIERSTADGFPRAGREERLSARARIMQNLSALGAGQLFTWVFTVGVTVLLPQHLGDENLGKLTIATSLTDLCGLFASLGITGYLIKEVARSGLDARSTILNSLALRLPLALGACLMAMASAALLGYDALTSRLVYLLCLSIVLTALTTAATAALHGMQQIRLSTLIGVVSKGLWFGSIALALYLGYGVVGVLVAANGVAVITLVATLGALARRGGLGGQLDLGSWRVILLGSLPFFVWQSAHMVYGQIDVILLSIFTRDAVVGWYGAAYRIISISVFVPTIIAAAVYPTLSAEAQHDPSEFRMIAKWSLRVVLLFTIPISLGTMLTADRLVGFFQYPDEFKHSVPLIIILASHMPMVGASIIFGFVLFARDLQKLWAITGIAAAILNPSLNLVLIPYFDRMFSNGAIGAAITTVLTELFMTAMALWLLRGTAFDWTDVMFGLRCLVAGLLMSCVVWLEPDLVLPLTVALGGLVYFSAAWVIRVVSVHDLRLLRSYALNRGSSLSRRTV